MKNKQINEHLYGSCPITLIQSDTIQVYFNSFGFPYTYVACSIMAEDDLSTG